MHNAKQPQTKSESLFLEYCGVRGYVANKIAVPADKTRHPDYELIIGQHRIIAEIKELQANREDKRMAKAIQEQRIESFGDEPGRRIRTHIEDAEGQLRCYGRQHLPCLVVLYDNIIVNGFRPNPPELFPADMGNPLYPYHIDVGMYGLQAACVRIHQDGKTESLGDSRGVKRTLRAGHHDSISAVASLHDYDLNRGLFLVVYHNFYAKNPLPELVFSDANDHQLKKPSHPEFCPGNWQPVHVVGTEKNDIE
jgi:hypothetical protein